MEAIEKDNARLTAVLPKRFARADLDKPASANGSTWSARSRLATKSLVRKTFSVESANTSSASLRRLKASSAASSSRPVASFDCLSKWSNRTRVNSSIPAAVPVGVLTGDRDARSTTGRTSPHLHATLMVGDHASSVGEPPTRAETCSHRSPLPNTNVDRVPERISASCSNSFILARVGFSASNFAVFA